MLALVGVGLAFASIARGGFLALSDDDYSRVVIAQEFAQAPTLDPSKTSWLPAPFWLYGGVMTLAPATLETARATALASALFASFLLFRAARLLRLSPVAGAAATVTIAALPTLRPLAVATVPEFLTHALVTYALFAFAARRELLSAGLALFVATLSRYETWPVAIVVALLALSASRRGGADSRRLFALAVLAALGPILWCGHGWLHHGSPLFFVKRVVEYKAALGEEARSSFELLSSVPRALVASEPEAFFFGFFALFFGRRLLDERDPRLSNVGIPLLAMVAVLGLGDYRGGAPTHHSERTLAAVWMSGVLAGMLVMTRAGFVRRGTLVLCALLASLPCRLAAVPSTFGPRPEEEEVGRYLRAHFAPEERFVVATTDYGYFAVLAAAGSPSRFTVLETHDPRHREVPLPIPPRIIERAAAVGACYAVLPLCVEMPGITPIGEIGAFSIAKLTRDGC